MASVCLCMIVKNEAHVIERCLRSVRRFVDGWVIVDTGSTDGTQAVIKEAMAGVWGQLYERPWVNFGHNRSEAMELARETGRDYLFVIDADEVLVGPASGVWPELTADSYLVTARFGGMEFTRKNITRASQPWYYEGVLHEYCTCAVTGLTEAVLPDVYIQVHREGARAKDKDKFRRDALVLEAARLDDPTNSRTVFYLAESYRGAGDLDKAIAIYRSRVEMTGGNDDEIWNALYTIGRCYEAKGDACWPDALVAYLDAWGRDTGRIEPLFRIGLRYHHKSQNEIAYMFMVRADDVRFDAPKRLFVEQDIYDYLYLLEYAVVCFCIGRHSEAVHLNTKLLDSGRLPDFARPRVIANRELSMRALGVAPAVPLAPPAPARPKITVLNVQPPGYVHSPALDPLLDVLVDGLAALDYDVDTASLPDGLTGQVIVIGAHLLPRLPNWQNALPPGTIIYNTEHTASDWITGDYLTLMRAHTVWDYSSDNAKAVAVLLGKPVQYVPFGYMPCLANVVQTVTKDIDVLFYGSMNDRRHAVLEKLTAMGLKVKVTFGVYGLALDDLIARAKVVLNIHFYLPGRLEILRVGYLMANQQAVLSERNEGEGLDVDLTGGFCAVPYEKLVQTCAGLVDNAVERKFYALAGFRAFSTRSEADTLRDALAATKVQEDRRIEGFSAAVQVGGYVPPVPTFEIEVDPVTMPKPRYNTSTETRLFAPPENTAPTHLIIGSGKTYDPLALNLDIDRRWKPDVVGDISAHYLVGMGQLTPGHFTRITATHVFEHVRDLIQAMTNCLTLLAIDGELHITVPYDLSYGAWQDPTHVRAFNERSWWYYTDWHWYLHWDEYRFDQVSCLFVGQTPLHEVFQVYDNLDPRLRNPRWIDEMQVVLRKRALTPEEIALGIAQRGGSSR